MDQIAKEKIDNIMEWFDFKKVHIAMKALNWTWRDGGVPSLLKIRGEAREMLIRCYYEEDHNIASGGFLARYYPESKDFEGTGKQYGCVL